MAKNLQFTARTVGWQAFSSISAGSQVHLTPFCKRSHTGAEADAAGERSPVWSGAIDAACWTSLRGTRPIHRFTRRSDRGFAVDSRHTARTLPEAKKNHSGTPKWSCSKAV